MSELSHIDAQGRARMVDVSAKPAVKRVARARGRILLQAATVALIRDGKVPKGDVLATARIAGIMAAKRTPDLIPLCHPLLISHVSVELLIEDTAVTAIAEVGCTGATGVEMEALSAVSATLLTVYDMVKAVDKTMTITDIVLLEKRKESL
jgi:cyclic pyranopterin phosphate synthase